MPLTPVQIAAATARGIRFTPATPEQVRRLSMQRRVFQIDGAPHLATRDGSFFETTATLEHLIAVYLAEEAQQQADLAAWEASGTAAPSHLTQPRQDAPPPLPAEQPAPAPESPVPRATEPVPAVAAAETAPTTPRRWVRHQRTPAWKTAGAERRGRVEQHWSARARR